MRDPVLFTLKSLAKLQCTFRRADLYFLSTVLLIKLKKITFQLEDRMNFTLKCSCSMVGRHCNNAMPDFPVESAVDSAYCS